MSVLLALSLGVNVGFYLGKDKEADTNLLTEQLAYIRTYPMPAVYESRLNRYVRENRAVTWSSYYPSTIDLHVFEPHGWIKTSKPEEATLVYCNRRKHHRKLTSRTGLEAAELPFLLNRVEQCRMLTDKASLQRTLANSNDGKGGTGLLIQPPTHIISNPSDCRKFLKTDWQDTTWVYKPATGSQGNGIAFFPRGHGEAPCDPNQVNEVSLVQSHIDYPLTLSGKKSEMRAYWLIASVDPFIVLLYNNGTTRLATNDYVYEDWDNKLIHVLNTRQQKLSGDYDKKANKLKWTWLEAATDLHRRGLIGDREPLDWVNNCLLKAFANNVRTVAGAAKATLQNPKNTHQKRRWEMMGMDIIMEDQVTREKAGRANNLGSGGQEIEGGLRMWMTEVQVGPGISVDSKVKKALMTEMLTEMFEIVLEVDDRRQSGMSLAKLDSPKNFVVIINEAK